MPILLDIADIPMSPYYNFLLDVSKQVPVIVSDKKYVDVYNQINNIEEGKYSDVIHKYFQIEYDKLTNPKRNEQFYNGVNNKLP